MLPTSYRHQQLRVFAIIMFLKWQTKWQLYYIEKKISANLLRYSTMKWQLFLQWPSVQAFALTLSDIRWYDLVILETCIQSVLIHVHVRTSFIDKFCLKKSFRQMIICRSEYIAGCNTHIGMYGHFHVSGNATNYE